MAQVGLAVGSWDGAFVAVGAAVGGFVRDLPWESQRPRHRTSAARRKGRGATIISFLRGSVADGLKVKRHRPC